MRCELTVVAAVRGCAAVVASERGRRERVRAPGRERDGGGRSEAGREIDGGGGWRRRDREKNGGERERDGGGAPV